MPSPTRPGSLSARPSRAALATACAVLLAAGTAGCSTPFGRATAVAEPPALLTWLPDVPDLSPQSAVLEPVAAALTVPAAKTPSAGSAPRVTRPARGPAAADAGSRAPAAAGPTVTTYTYSDAPVAVRPASAQTAGRAAPGGRPAAVPPGFNPYRVAMPSGAYRCELGRSVQVRDVSTDMRTTVLRWGSRDYTLNAVHARSGALRYEDPTSGLAWIVIPGTSMLLDTRGGQRLANACRT